MDNMWLWVLIIGNTNLFNMKLTREHVIQTQLTVKYIRISDDFLFISVHQ